MVKTTTVMPPNNAQRAKVKPIGCLYPFCACPQGRLGCAHEPYDMKHDWNTPVHNHPNKGVSSEESDA